MSPLTEAFSKPFIDRLLVYLIPYFIRLTDNIDEAAKEALLTLETYGARTRAELLHATRIIVFTYAGMDMANEATLCGHLPDAFRHRLRTSGNALSKSAQADEKALLRRLKTPPPAPTKLTGKPKTPAAGQPVPNVQAAEAPAADPACDMPDEMAQELLDVANAQVEAFRNRARMNRRAEPPPAQDPPTRNPILQHMAEEMRQILAQTSPPAAPG